MAQKDIDRLVEERDCLQWHIDCQDSQMAELQEQVQQWHDEAMAHRTHLDNAVNAGSNTVNGENNIETTYNTPWSAAEAVGKLDDDMSRMLSERLDLGGPRAALVDGDSNTRTAGGAIAAGSGNAWWGAGVVIDAGAGGATQSCGQMPAGP